MFQAPHHRPHRGRMMTALWLVWHGLGCRFDNVTDFRCCSPFLLSFCLGRPRSQFSNLGISLPSSQLISSRGGGGCWHWADLMGAVPFPIAGPMPTGKRGTGTTGNRYRWDAGAGGSVGTGRVVSMVRDGEESVMMDQGNVGSWDCDRVVWRSGRDPGSGGHEPSAAEEIQRACAVLSCYFGLGENGDGSVGSWRSVGGVIFPGAGPGQTGPGLARGGSDGSEN